MIPPEMPHQWGLVLVQQNLRMWYNSILACVMHIVEPRDMPFATHDTITANTISVTLTAEHTGILRQACPICLETFCVRDTVRRLPCMHVFHVVGAEADPSQDRHCNIDRHLVCDKQCPVCKTPIDIMERLDRTAVKSVEPCNPEMDTCQAPPIPLLQAERAPRGSGGLSPETIAGAEASTGGVVAESAARDQQHEMMNATEEAPNNAGAGNLPASAAELERAVRSLQSRWVQIQGVVVGMQQMLHHIEESHSVLNVARQGPGERLPVQTVQGASEGVPAEVPQALEVQAGAHVQRRAPSRAHWSYTDTEREHMAQMWRQRCANMERAGVGPGRGGVRSVNASLNVGVDAGTTSSTDASANVSVVDTNTTTSGNGNVANAIVNIVADTHERATASADVSTPDATDVVVDDGEHR